MCKYYYLIHTFSMQMRIAYHGLIYRKVRINVLLDTLIKSLFQVLRLSSHSLNTFSSGEITNIFSNDASQIEMTVGSINYLWVIDVYM
jgi:ABC-type multidrug transport system fused ATPase/permease subunit